MTCSAHISNFRLLLNSDTRKREGPKWRFSGCSGFGHKRSKVKCGQKTSQLCAWRKTTDQNEKSTRFWPKHTFFSGPLLKFFKNQHFDKNHTFCTIDKISASCMQVPSIFVYRCSKSVSRPKLTHVNDLTTCFGSSTLPRDQTDDSLKWPKSHASTWNPENHNFEGAITVRRLGHFQRLNTFSRAYGVLCSHIKFAPFAQFRHPETRGSNMAIFGLFRFWSQTVKSEMWSKDPSVMPMT